MKPATLLLLAAFATHAAAVPLCLSKLTMTDNSAILRAEAIVTKLFVDAGVRVEWLSDKHCNAKPVGALYLLLEGAGPPHFNPGTLGYAQPYSYGTAVHIFYGRIQEDHPRDFAVVLGYVMAHEIAHVVQGIARHSQSGIMKPVWTHRDYGDMHFGQMRFDGEDVQLLDRGLKELAASSFAARF